MSISVGFVSLEWILIPSTITITLQCINYQTCINLPKKISMYYLEQQKESSSYNKKYDSKA